MADGVGIGQSGVLGYMTPSALDKYDLEQAKARADAQQRPQPPVPELCGYIKGQYEIFRNHRNTVNGWSNRLIEALRAYNGQYNPTKEREVKKFGGSEIYARISAAKCRATTSLLRDIYMGPDRPWGIKPPADPPIPPQVIQQIHTLIQSEQTMIMQTTGQVPSQDDLDQRAKALVMSARDAAKKKARDQAKVSEDKIEEMLLEGGFYHALADFLVDLPIFPFGCIKGPVVKFVPKVLWPYGGGRPTIQNVPTLTWVRVSPFDLWWTPGVSDISNAQVIEKSRLTRHELNDCLDLPGFNHDEVYAVLQEYGRGGLYDAWDMTDAERAVLESRENPAWNRSGMITQYEFNGNVYGEILAEYGMPGITDPVRDYHVQAWCIGGHVIKSNLSPSPRARHPYFITSFEKVPGTPVGNGLTDIVSDIQEAGNATLRALVNNMSIACLTGDTIVYRWRPWRQRNQNNAKVTLAQLWAQKNQSRSGLRRNVLRALDETTGEFIGNRIVDIIDNGIQDVFKIKTVAGYEIKATATHRFMAGDGSWRRLGAMKVGDLIGVNGTVLPLPLYCRRCHTTMQPSTSGLRRYCDACVALVQAENKQRWLAKNTGLCVDCGAQLKHHRSTRCRSCSRKVYQLSLGHQLKQDLRCADCGAQLAKSGAKRCKSCAVKATLEGSWNQRQALAALQNRDVLDTTARQRFLVQAQKKLVCESCGTADELEVHHLDKDPWNCNPSNLKTLCEPCHKKWHARHDYFGANPALHQFLDYDLIESIEWVGKEQVFDLSMQAPNHNFVANGFISHNSGPQVVINDDRILSTENTEELFPWKRWHARNDPIGTNNKAPVEFFQPQDNSQSLMMVFKMFVDLGDDISAIPRYISSQSPGSAGRTSSGLAMLMQNASKMMQTVAANIDRDVFEQALMQLSDLLLLTDTSGLLNGEEDITVQGVSVAVQRETQRQRQIEFLQHTANPMDQQITGITGRGEVLRAVAQDIGLDGSKVVPSEQELQALDQQQKAQAQQNGSVQQVLKGLQEGAEAGAKRIGTELVAGILAQQTSMPEGGPTHLGTLPQPMGGPPASGMQEAAAQAQGSQPSQPNRSVGPQTNLTGSQPTPSGPAAGTGGKPPAPAGGPQ